MNENNKKDAIQQGIEYAEKVAKHFDDEMRKQLAFPQEYVKEVYNFKETSEYEGEQLITDRPSSPLNTYEIKEYWGVNASEDIKMEVHLKHDSVNDDDVRPDYADLIINLRKAKYRNEIICNEILNK